MTDTATAAAPRREPPVPIPLTILTGFLGAGKTTVLNRLLRDPDLSDTVVIVNEFGEVGLDHLLVEKAEDGLVLLSAGCLCCTVRGDLVSTLEDLLRRRDNGRIEPFRRVVIETTGLADPAPVIAAVLYHPYLSRRYAVDGVVTVVDAVLGVDTIGRHEEARRQAAVADRIVLTKTDLAEDRGASVRGELAKLNPAAPVIVATGGAVPAGSLLAGGLFRTDGKIGDVAEWLGAEARETGGHGHHVREHVGHGHHHDHAHGHRHDVSRHSDRIGSIVLRSPEPLSEAALDLFLDLLRSTLGPKLLRLKGLVALRSDPSKPLLIHGVQHVLHVPAMLPGWPDENRDTRIVVIAEDTPLAAIERMWGAFSGRPAADQPDAAALLDNPLAPPTLARA